MTSSDTGEEDVSHFTNVYDELRQMLRGLQLPLAIQSISYSSATLRYSDVNDLNLLI